MTFDIDANGILHVSAKDKGTGKEQSIQIRASSGLSDDEIENMVRDAEAHAAEDKKFHELVTARNTADNMLHSTEKALEDLGDQVDAEEKSRIEAAMEALREAIKGDDKDDIEGKTKALAEVSSKLAERVYAQQASAQGGAADAEGFTDAAQEAAKEQQGSGGAKPDDVVDAEFEEVKDK